MTAVLKLAAPPGERAIVSEPDIDGLLRVNSAREHAGRKFIEIGEKILSGELAGGRCEWRCNSWLEHENGRNTQICTVELTPQVDDAWVKGRTQLCLFTLIEEG